MRGLLVAGVFLAILGGHFLYATRRVLAPKGVWASYEFEQPKEPRWFRYTESGEYWLGLSYGLAGAFAAFCLGRTLKKRRESLTASAGGLTLSGMLWVGLCFIAGCCGSPMLPVYLGLLGPKFAGVTKPMTFGVTIISILVGYTLMRKRAESREA